MSTPAPRFPESLKEFSVLVVEDNAAARQLITKLLGSLGFHRVTAVENGAAAIELLQYGRPEPDLILCDWQMPHVDGLQVLTHVQGGRAHSLFIMVTAANSMEAAMLAKAHGVDGYLIKPVTKVNLMAAIEGVAARMKLA